MIHQKPDFAALGSFFISGIATISSWQLDMEFWLKIVVTVIGGLAGAFSLYRNFKAEAEDKRRKRRTRFE